MITYHDALKLDEGLDELRSTMFEATVGEHSAEQRFALLKNAERLADILHAGLSACVRLSEAERSPS